VPVRSPAVSSERQRVSPNLLDSAIGSAGSTPAVAPPCPVPMGKDPLSMLAAGRQKAASPAPRPPTALAGQSEVAAPRPPSGRRPQSPAVMEQAARRSFNASESFKHEVASAVRSSSPLAPVHPPPRRQESQSVEQAMRISQSAEPFRRSCSPRSSAVINDPLLAPMRQRSGSVGTSAQRQSCQAAASVADPGVATRHRAQQVAADQFADAKDREDSLLRMLDNRQQRVVRSVM
jgi:hypothetical protein